MMMTIVYSFVFYDVPWPAKKYNVSGGRQGEWKRWGGTAERGERKREQAAAAVDETGKRRKESLFAHVRDARCPDQVSGCGPVA